MRVDQYVWCLGCLVLGLVATGCSAPASNTEEAFHAMAVASLAQIEGETELAGLRDEVEVLRDRWGVPHIYAQNTDDLFFAQGYIAAQDRLWQLDMWRRWLEGRTAEISGPERFEADRMMRLLSWRGGLSEEELGSYHPETERILEAFVEGINAFIEASADNLPVEFKLTGLRPEPWTLETPTLRSTLSGVGGNIASDLRLAQRVASMGPEEANRRANPDPFYELVVPDGFDPTIITGEVLRAFSTRAGRGFAVDLLPEYQQLETIANGSPIVNTMLAGLQWSPPMPPEYRDEIGSNNWVVSGALTQDGWPMMINDPHRAQAVPSLRYWAHLVGPGWNVIGGGEPEIPGISIGHNEHGAWGLTVFNTDGEDLYVYETNPDNPNQYFYNGQWEEMRIITETFNVKSGDPVTVDLKYTRHGPVSFEDGANDLAYAIRPAWMEVGGAPYLASLRMDQAKTWEEFRVASNYSNIPGENMIWADRDGNIGWQAVGIAPIRRNFSGMVPVSGDGRYEWDGYLPIIAKPHEYNPDRGYIETSNSNYTPPDFPYLDAIGYTWTDPFRWARGSEVLGSGRKFNMTDMIELQHDYLSIPARTLIPFFRDVEADNPQVEQARQMLLSWDFVLDKNSIEAGIYVAFERQLLDNIELLKVPVEAQRYISVGMKTTIDMLLAPDGDFGEDPIQGRDRFLLRTLAEGIATLREKLGPNVEDWVYGQENYKHAIIRHPLGPAVNDELRARLNVGPAPRGGNGFTLGNTGSGDNQTSGASFRIFVDTRDWDNTLGMNTPGQGFYKVLAESALRAIRICQPLRVPPTGYEKWKDLQLNFDANEMLKG